MTEAIGPVAQPTREEAVRILEEGDRRMRALLGKLTEEDLVRTGAIGGGTWSAKDLVGHVAFWEEIALESLAAWRAGREPAIEATFTGGGTDDLNEWNERRKKSWPLHRVRAEAAATHRMLIQEIEGMSEEEWRSKAPHPTERRGRLVTELGAVLGAPKRPFGHAFAHLPDLEAHVRSVPSS